MQLINILIFTPQKIGGYLNFKIIFYTFAQLLINY